MKTIVLLTPDTLRRDAVGAFRGPARTRATPHLDALVARGVAYDEARTCVPLTLPAHATMLTGLLPPQHGLRTNASPAWPLERGFPTVTERVAAAGWRTGAFVSTAVLAAAKGLAAGFERYDDAGFAAATIYSPAERSGTATVDAALAWIASTARDDRVFLWVHLFDAHAPYDEDGTYLGDVARVDGAVGRLLAGLARLGRGDAAVLLVADHGEALGELGEATHGLLLGDAVLRVPLALVVPGATPGRRGDPVGLERVAPTIAGLAGVSLPGLAPSLVAAPTTTAADVLPAETFYGEDLHGWAQLVAAGGPSGTLVELGGERFHWLSTAQPGEGQLGPELLPTTSDLEHHLAAIAAYKGLARGRAEGSQAPAADEPPPYYGGGASAGMFLSVEENGRRPDPYASIGMHLRLDSMRATLALARPPPGALAAIETELGRMAERAPADPEIPFVRGRALARAAETAARPEPLLVAARDAFLAALAAGRRGEANVFLAVDAEHRRAGLAGDRAAAAQAALDLFERIESDRGPCVGCQALLLRIRLLGDLPDQAGRREELCRAAAAACQTPDDRRRLQATCPP